MGHSMGGYTVLNLASLRKDITKVVALSPFLSIPTGINAILKNKFIASRILAYERKVEPELYKNDVIGYLKETTDNILFIQSTDDQMVPPSISIDIVESINNPHIEIVKYTNRKHNPNYTDAAIEYMNNVFGTYNYLIKTKEIKTDEQKINYFKDVSLAKLVEQDEKLFDKIKDFIEKK